MITGRKAAHLVPAREAIGSSLLWLAAPLVALLVGALTWIVFNAPAASADGGDF